MQQVISNQTNDVSDFFELDESALDMVAGGNGTEVSNETGWAVATGTAVALAVGGATVTAAPMVAVALLAAAIASSATASYYVTR